MGAFEGDSALPLGGPKQRLVLALLLVRADQVVPADRLIDEVWGEQPPATKRGGPADLCVAPAQGAWQ